jgi:2-isopropylmalate synthase
MAVAGVRLAKAYTPDVEFSAEDATRTDVDYLCAVVEAVLEAGATVINIPDTVGYTLPTEFGALIRTLKRRVPTLGRATLSVHCHNDLGLAVANSLAAVETGARQVECTVNGIGERAGNASLEEFVMALKVRADRLPFETGIDAAQITRASQLLTHITGVAVQPHKAIVGRNAFAHEAGIHQHGVLAHRSTYEIMTPESVGARVQSLVLGKHSGRHALQQRLSELGFELERAGLDKAYRLFTKLADQKKEIFDEDLVAIVQDGLSSIPEAWKLRAVQATAGTSATATALVTLFDGEAERTETAAGDGPVNAVCAAMDKLTGLRGTLLDFSVRGITGGADAVGEVHVHVDFEGTCATGRAASTDIVDAAARAYLNAANRVAHRRAHAPSAPATATA